MSNFYFLMTSLDYHAIILQLNHEKITLHILSLRSKHGKIVHYNVIIMRLNHEETNSTT